MVEPAPTTTRLGAVDAYRKCRERIRQKNRHTRTAAQTEEVMSGGCLEQVKRLLLLFACAYLLYTTFSGET